ncbi:organic cation transporter protein-like isoform X2 [Crassostrea virginica]
MALAGVSLLIVTLISTFRGTSVSLGYLSTCMVLLGKYGISGAFSSIFLYTSALYPTNLRNSGYGYASVFARVGSVLAPFSSTFHSYVSWGPGVVFSIMCFLSTIMICYLPETRDHELPTTIEELKMWYKTHSGVKMSGKKLENGTVKMYINQVRNLLLFPYRTLYYSGLVPLLRLCRYTYKVEPIDANRPFEMEQNLDVDEIWRALRPWGLYQIRQMAFMWAANLPCSVHLLAVVFIGYRPDFHCADILPVRFNASNDTVSDVTYNECSVTLSYNLTNSSRTTDSCPNGYKYNAHDDISFVTEWGLVCDESTKVDISQSLMLLGQGIGGFLCTGLSDKFGRKTVHIVSHVTIFVLCLITSFIPSYVGYITLRFFTGMAVEGLLLSSVTMYVETLPREWRFCAEVIGVSLWTTGVVLLTPFAYLMRNFSWRYLQLLLSLLSVYSLIEYWLFDESLRWLMANGRLDEAEKVVRKAAKMNKLSFESVISNVKAKMEELESLKEDKVVVDKISTNPDITIVAYNPKNTEVKKYSMTDILRDRLILTNSVIIWFLWVSNSLTYYGLNLTSPTLYGDRFLNFFFLGVIEYASAFTEYLLLNRIGRKKTLFYLMALAGVSLLIATLISTFRGTSVSLGYLSTCMVLLGKYGISGAFSSIFLYTSELYPTNLRNSGYGYASVFARVGGVLAPFSSTFHSYVSWGPGVVFSIMCFLSTIMICYLPETRDHELPTTIEELKMWYKTHSGVKMSGKKLEMAL